MRGKENSRKWELEVTLVGGVILKFECIVK